MSKTNVTLTQDRLLEVLQYDYESGLFTRRIASARMPAGSPANSIDPSTGYVRFGVDGKLRYAHRLVWLYVHGRWPSETIDHINGDKTDNRLRNLREATYAQNSENRRARNMTANRTSKYLGVHWAKQVGKFCALIGKNRKKTVIGYFDSEDEASAAYLAAKRELHEFSTL